MFTMYGHDNDISFFEDREDAKRCATCGQLLAKWEEDLSTVRMPRKLKYDVSTSYDGVVVVSARFRELYEAKGMTGLQFIPLSESAFAIQATRLVQFDAVSRGTRFVDKCDACGQYESVVGAAPAFLTSGADVAEMGFARTDLEFGSGDEKSPVLICGDSAATALREAKLKGIDLEEVRCS
jgi:hypothetical protein